MRLRKLVCGMVTAAMILSLAACSGSGNTGSVDTGTSSASGTASDAAVSVDASGSQDTAGTQTGNAGPEALTLPIAEGAELSVWTMYENPMIEDMSIIAGVQKMEEITGVHINYTGIGLQEVSEKYGLMLSSGNYPDIIYASGTQYPGGTSKAIEDGVYIDCHDLIVNYMPNYYGLVTADPELEKAAKTDDGRFQSIHVLMSSNTTVRPEMTWSGLGYRKDMLDAWGKSEPETIDEWHELLTFAKEQGVTSPLLIGANGGCNFSLAYGTLLGWYRDGDRVVYGPYTDNFGAYLDLMKTWYSEGLIDKNFSSGGPMASIMVDSAMIENNTAFAVPVISGFSGNQMAQRHMVTNESAYIQAIKNPVLNAGDTHVRCTNLDAVSWSAYITTNCKDPVLAAKWLDYQYTIEGMFLNFYGVEGESYTMDGDTVVFTDAILSDPSGLSPADALGYYARGNGLGRYATDVANYYTTMDENQDMQARIVWDDQVNIVLPANMTMTDAEGTEYNSLYTDIETLTEEYCANYIMGADNRTFDEFRAALQQYGIERCIEIQQAAFDRYNAR